MTFNRPSILAVHLGLWVLGCTGDTKDPAGTPEPVVPTDGSGSADPNLKVQDRPPMGFDPNALDPGYIPARRLNNTEYDNTVRDLLGTQLRPGDFVQATTVTGFDTNARALAGVNTAIATSYFNAAESLVEDLLARPEVFSQIADCQPAGTGDVMCAQSVIGRFGLKAYRRPLEDAEVTRFTGLYQRAMSELSYDHAGAIGHVLRIMLSSPNFLYRIEADPNIAEAVAGKRPLNGYELASRLSYTLWSSTPDDTLYALAAAGELTSPEVLQQQVERMLNAPAGAAFLENFVGQWLAIRQFTSHQADQTVFPVYDEALRQAMSEDARRYVGQFLLGGRPWADFLTAPLDTSDPLLAPLYEQDPPGARIGFLSLPAFLSVTSLPERTAPTLRGRVVLETLLCTQTVPPPDIDIPLLEEMSEEPASDNVREAHEAHRSMPACAGCHQVLDPIGLGLENFDAIGRFRTNYGNGDSVDASGEIAGTHFVGSVELASLLAVDPRFLPCPAEMLLSYALNRVPGQQDKPYLGQLATEWNGGNLLELARQFVAGDTFRFRKLPAEAL